MCFCQSGLVCVCVFEVRCLCCKSLKRLSSSASAFSDAGSIVECHSHCFHFPVGKCFADEWCPGFLSPLSHSLRLFCFPSIKISHSHLLPRVLFLSPVSQHLCVSAFVYTKKMFTKLLVRVHKSALCAHINITAGLLSLLRDLGSYGARCIIFLCPVLWQHLRAEGFSIVFVLYRPGISVHLPLSSVWVWDSMSSVRASLKEARFSRQKRLTRITHLPTTVSVPTLVLCPLTHPFTSHYPYYYCWLFELNSMLLYQQYCWLFSSSDHLLHFIIH